MYTDHIKTIDDVLLALDEIIQNSKQDQNTSGYFTALYRKVTQKVKEGIQNNTFEDGVRMERLDVIFANRYLEAYYANQKGTAVTLSWQKAFGLSTEYWPIVLQHLLIGMNAHISLDLGIAAAEVSQGKSLEQLHGDFNKINDILAALVQEVQQDLAAIWPTLHKILRWTKGIDDIITDFSMQLARDGAWRFANRIFEQPEADFEHLIQERDQKVATNANIITQPGFLTKMILFRIRISERGSISQKITQLNN